MSVKCFIILLAAFFVGILIGMFLPVLISIPFFLQDNRSWMHIIEVFSSPIITLGLACFAYKSFWPDFKKQRRIENLSIDAKEVLTMLNSLEDMIREMYRIRGVNDSDDKHFDIQKKLLIKFRDLRSALLLVMQNEDLLENEQVKYIAAKIESYQKILQHSYANEIPDSFKSIDLLQELNFIDEKDRNIRVIEDLRSIMLKIYKNHST